MLPQENFAKLDSRRLLIEAISKPQISHVHLIEWSCSQAPAQLSVAGSTYCKSDGKLDGAWDGAWETRLVMSDSTYELNCKHVLQVAWPLLQ